MVRKLLITCLLTILIGGVCFAEKSITIQVSATIPSLPGINTPYIEKEEWLNENKYEPEIKTEVINLTQKEELSQDEKSEEIVKEAKPKTILRKTLYVR